MGQLTIFIKLFLRAASPCAPQTRQRAEKKERETQEALSQTWKKPVLRNFLKEACSGELLFLFSQLLKKVFPDLFFLVYK